jgi:hypothetical protein
VSYDLFCSVTNCTGVLNVETEGSYGAITASATIECTGTSLVIGDSISIDMGYVGNHRTLFSGFVKKIKRDKPTQTITITANDLLVRAVDCFLAARDPENPLTYHSIKDRDLVNDLLGQCGLSLSSGAVSPTFTYGTNPDGAKFNLQSVADAINSVCAITGRICYADGGLIYYVDRKPYIVAGDTATTFFSTALANILEITYEASNDKLRNKVVVYGKSPLAASARADSIYVVVDQAAVIAHELLDTQTLCDATANVNLEIMNRLGRTWTITAIGDPSIKSKTICNIYEPFTQSDDDAFIYRANHRLSTESSQYITEVTATA